MEDNLVVVQQLEALAQMAVDRAVAEHVVDDALVRDVARGGRGGGVAGRGRVCGNRFARTTRGDKVVAPQVYPTLLVTFVIKSGSWYFIEVRAGRRNLRPFSLCMATLINILFGYQCRRYDYETPAF